MANPTNNSPEDRPDPAVGEQDEKNTQDNQQADKPQTDKQRYEQKRSDRSPEDKKEAAKKDAASSRKRKFWLIGIVVLVIILGLLMWAWYEMYGRYHESTDDAYVNGNVVQITPLVTGTVISIGADDGDLVHEGQVLVQFDPADAAVGLESAEANLGKTVRQVRGLYSNVDSLKAQVGARQSDVKRAQDNYKRRKSLADGGAISQEELSHAKDDLDQAQSNLVNARQQLSTSAALVDDTQIANHPDVKSAAAQLRQAYLTNARSTLVAPVTGYVAQRSVQVGQRVQPGAALMSVIPMEQMWIDANFKETQLPLVRIGQPVDITTDLYGDDVPFGGTIESIGAGTGSAFALLPAQNATGNWIKIVQRVPVRVSINPDDLKAHPLRIGLSTVVNVDLHHTNGPVLAQQSSQQPSFSTNIYNEQLVEADALIEKLIHDNSAAVPDKTAKR